MSLDRRGRALLVAAVALAVAAGAVVAASGASITADPNSPNDTATHSVTVAIDGDTVGASWTGLEVVYEASDASNVGQNDVTTIGIDRGNDDPGTTIDVDVSNDLSSVSASSDGQTLDIGLGGNYDLEQGDEIVVQYEDVQNPDAGTYSVSMDVNPQSSGGTASASLSIQSDTTTTTTSTTTTTTTTTSTQTTTTTTSETTTSDTTTETTSETQTTTDSQTTTQTTTTSSESSDARNASLSVMPDDPNVTATHSVTVTASSASAGSWNGLLVNYTDTGADVSDVGQNDIVKVGIDRGNDDPGNATDVTVSDDLSSVSASSNGQVLTVGLGGSYDVDAGDQLVVVYEDATNPSAGTYDVPVDLNPQSSGGEAMTELSVAASAQSTTTTVQSDENTQETPQTTSSVTSTETTTNAITETTTTTEESSSGSPGFGVAVAVIAALAVALLARRE